MQAESFTGYGGLKLVEVPRPTLAAGRALVRTTASGVSPLGKTVLAPAIGGRTHRYQTCSALRLTCFDVSTSCTDPTTS